MTIKVLARFRADPEKVRTSLRPVGGKWRATVESLLDGKQITSTSALAETAMLRALKKAEKEEMPGIDLDMGRSYDHPWGTV